MTISGTLSNYNIGAVGLITMMGGVQNMVAHQNKASSRNESTKEEDKPMLPVRYCGRDVVDLASILEEASKIILFEEEIAEAHRQQERERREARELREQEIAQQEQECYEARVRREQEIASLTDAARQVALEPKLGSASSSSSHSPQVRLQRQNSSWLPKPSSRSDKALAA